MKHPNCSHCKGHVDYRVWRKTFWNPTRIHDKSLVDNPPRDITDSCADITPNTTRNEAEQLVRGWNDQITWQFNNAGVAYLFYITDSQGK